MHPLKFKNAVADATGNINVRATNAETDWVDMRDYDRLFAFLQCDHSNFTDTITTLKLEQATSAAGAGKKDLTTSGAGGNYDTSVDTLAAADSAAILEARAEDMDSNNGFHFARLYVAATGNTGADNVFGFLLRHQANDKRRALQGSPSPATQVYVTPQRKSSDTYAGG